MSKSISGPSVYIPTDKNIFDALQHKKVTHHELISFLRKRGIFVSLNATKQALTEKISSLVFSYADMQWLSKLLENPNKKDKSTHSTLKGEILQEQINAACQTVKENLKAVGDDTVSVKIRGDKTVLVINYLDHDFSKTELRQRTNKTCEIQIDKGIDGIVMKMPSNKKAKEITDLIKKSLKYQVQQSTGLEPEECYISLESIANPAMRSSFFDYLIRNISGFKFDNVSSVDVYHFEQDKLNEFEDDEGSDRRLASYINKAGLAGEGVLDSTEFNQLHSRGFYIYKIIWTAIELIEDGPKVEFEASFGNASSCNEFMYLVRGLFPYNNRTLDYNVTRVSVSPFENEKYNIKLREASEQSLQFVKDKYGA